MRQKVWMTGLGVLLAAALLAPAVMGFVIERVYDEILRQTAEQAAGRYEIEGRFERGWLASEAETTLRLVGGSSDVVFEVPLYHDIVHGPIPIGELMRGRSPLHFLFAVVDTHYFADPRTLPTIAETLGARPLLALQAWMGFDRSALLRLHSPEFSIDGGRYHSEGLRGDIELDPSTGLAWGRVRLGALSLDEPSGSLRFSGSTLHFDGRQADEGGAGEDIAVARFTGSWEIGSLQMSSPDGGRGALEESVARFEGGLDAAGDLVDGSLEIELGDLAARDGDDASGAGLALRGVRISESTSRSADTGLNGGDMVTSFEQLVLDGRRYGPGRLVMSAKNFDQAAWEAFGEALSAVQEQAGISDEERAQAQIAVLDEHLPRVFGVSPLLTVERMELEAPSGRLEASGKLGVDGSEPDLLGNPFFLLAAIQAEAHVLVSAELFHELLDRYLEESAGEQAGELPPEDMREVVLFMREATLSQLLERGTLVRDGGLYRFDARMEEGLPYLNGEPADPSFLMGIMPGM
jgi:uncharacterized protein YdgA (DUF945 family)